MSSLKLQDIVIFVLVAFGSTERASSAFIPLSIKFLYSIKQSYMWLR